MTIARCPLCEGAETRALPGLPASAYRRCGECSLTFLLGEHHLSPAEERSRYELHRNDPGDPEYRNFLARLADALVPRLRPLAEGLDFGCGPGPALVAMLHEQGFAVDRYDPFFHADQAALRRTYDFITSTETFEHFRAPAREIALLDRLLRPGGWLGVMTAMLERDEDFSDWHYRRDPTHVCFYRRETMEWVGRRWGWSVDFPRPNVTLFHKRGSNSAQDTAAGDE